MADQSQKHRDTLKGLFRQPPKGSIPMTIAPGMAGVMLEHNIERNRTHRDKITKLYSRQMAEGKWEHTGEAIIFSRSGRLIDGQHRLRACVLAKTSFKTDVRFGMAEAAYDNIDTGKMRSAGDIFKNHGYENWERIATASRFVAAYFDFGWKGKSGGFWGTAKELQEYIADHHPKLTDSLKVYEQSRKYNLPAPGAITAMHYVCKKRSIQTADIFFSKLTTGLNIDDANDPVARLRTMLIDIKTNAWRAEVNRVHVAALIVIAWNQYRGFGRKNGKIEWRQNDRTEPFPKAM